MSSQNVEEKWNKYILENGLPKILKKLLLLAILKIFNNILNSFIIWYLYNFYIYPIFNIKYMYITEVLSAYFIVKYINNCINNSLAFDKTNIRKEVMEIDFELFKESVFKNVFNITVIYITLKLINLF